MSLTTHERDYLASQPLGRLATVDSDGHPQNNPVGFDYDENSGIIDIGGFSMGTTRKFANVATTPFASLVVDELVSKDPWTVRGIELRGRAEAISGQEPRNSYSGPDHQLGTRSRTPGDDGPHGPGRQRPITSPFSGSPRPG
jgi:pyridoxamine 5'-phosphate oxidase family protein